MIPGLRVEPITHWFEDGSHTEVESWQGKRVTLFSVSLRETDCSFEELQGKVFPCFSISKTRALRTFREAHGPVRFVEYVPCRSNCLAASPSQPGVGPSCGIPLPEFPWNIPLVLLDFFVCWKPQLVVFDALVPILERAETRDCQGYTRQSGVLEDFEDWTEGSGSTLRRRWSTTQSGAYQSCTRGWTVCGCRNKPSEHGCWRLRSEALKWSPRHDGKQVTVRLLLAETNNVRCFSSHLTTSCPRSPRGGLAWLPHSADECTHILSAVAFTNVVLPRWRALDALDLASASQQTSPLIRTQPPEAVSPALIFVVHAKQNSIMSLHKPDLRILLDTKPAPSWLDLPWDQLLSADINSSFRIGLAGAARNTLDGWSPIQITQGLGCPRPHVDNSGMIFAPNSGAFWRVSVKVRDLDGIRHSQGGGIYSDVPTSVQCLPPAPPSVRHAVHCTVARCSWRPRSLC